MEAATPAPEPAQSNRVVGIMLGSILVVVALGLIVFFATRESDEEKALQAVCQSRADIKARVSNLAGTTVTNFSLDAFKEDVQGISNDVATIRNESKKLSPNRRQQIQQANQQFETAVTTSLKSLGSSLSIDNAQAKLKSAGQQLVSSYKTALEPVDCSGVDLS